MNNLLSTIHNANKDRPNISHYTDDEKAHRVDVLASRLKNAHEYHKSKENAHKNILDGIDPFDPSAPEQIVTHNKLIKTHKDLGSTALNAMNHLYVASNSKDPKDAQHHWTSARDNIKTYIGKAGKTDLLTTHQDVYQPIVNMMGESIEKLDELSAGGWAKVAGLAALKTVGGVVNVAGKVAATVIGAGSPSAGAVIKGLTPKKPSKPWLPTIRDYKKGLETKETIKKLPSHISASVAHHIERGRFHQGEYVRLRNQHIARHMAAGHIRAVAESRADADERVMFHRDNAVTHGKAVMHLSDANRHHGAGDMHSARTHIQKYLNRTSHLSSSERSPHHSDFIKIKNMRPVGESMSTDFSKSFKRIPSTEILSDHANQISQHLVLKRLLGKHPKQATAQELQQAQLLLSRMPEDMINKMSDKLVVRLRQYALNRVREQHNSIMSSIHEKYEEILSEWGGAGEAATRANPEVQDHMALADHHLEIARTAMANGDRTGALKALKKSNDHALAAANATPGGHKVGAPEVSDYKRAVS